MWSETEWQTLRVTFRGRSIGSIRQLSDEPFPLKPSVKYMYRQFNVQQFYVLPTQLYLFVLCGSENKQRLFPYTALTDWFI